MVFLKGVFIGLLWFLIYNLKLVLFLSLGIMLVRMNDNFFGEYEIIVLYL